MSYTARDARWEIGNSTSWEDARVSSIKKWEQIASGDDSYPWSAHCGFCYVANNLGVSCQGCPALSICDNIYIDTDAGVVLEMLRELSLSGEETCDARP